MVTAPDTVIPPPSESAVREGSEPVPRYVHPQKFCPEKERAAAAAHLSEHGFVVFSHALTVAECEHALGVSPKCRNVVTHPFERQHEIELTTIA